MIELPQSLTTSPAAAIFAALALTILLLHIIRCVIWQKGICPLPSIMLLGFWGVSITPWLMFVSIGYKDHEALIAHERSHQMQQRRDGLLTFWSNYIFDKEMKLKYEVEAYKVWLEVNPKDREKVIFWLMNGYDFELSRQEVEALIS
jgi:hypothetical protein